MMNRKIRFLKQVWIPQRCFTGRYQAEMPWPSLVLMKSHKILKKAEKSLTFHSRSPRATGETHFMSVSVHSPAPWPPALPLPRVGVKAWEVLCWIPGFICINHFPVYQYKKYAPWPKYSNLSAACQTTHLPEWSQARLLFGSNLSLPCNKTICL